MTDRIDGAVAEPDARVSTGWVAAHLHDPDVRLVASDARLLSGEHGRIPGTIAIDVMGGLQALDCEGFLDLMRRMGARPNTKVVCYGTDDDAPAEAARDTFLRFGHARTQVMEGGLACWAEEGRPLVVEFPRYPPSDYASADEDGSRERTIDGATTAGS